mmetsp:Transcript_17187/g.32722  ORF Transcript_17187/g.32722 Transcript_17187/m.32722 type:complete len:467 (-) Transcript_17187:256-1656(-)
MSRMQSVRKFIIPGFLAAAAAYFLHYLYTRIENDDDVKDEKEDNKMMNGVLVCSPTNWPANLVGDVLESSPGDLGPLLTVATYNTLRCNYRFSDHGAWVPDEYRSWEYRKALLHQQLDSFKADILFLEETELRGLQKDFVSILEPKGYNYVTARPGGGHDHTKPVIFYRRDKLVLVGEKPKSRVAIAEFLVKENGQRLIVAGCHLQGGHQAPTRYNQARSLLKAMDSMLKGDRSASSSRSPSRRNSAARKSSRRGNSDAAVPNAPSDDTGPPKGRGVPGEGKYVLPEGTIPPPPACLVCGDMNAFGDDPSYELFTKGHVAKWPENEGDPPSKLSFRTGPVGALEDAFRFMDDSKEGRPFTYQRGSAGSKFRIIRFTIDYIFHTPPRFAEGKTSEEEPEKPRSAKAKSRDPALEGGLQVVAVRKPLSEKRERLLSTKVGLPNRWHPSDHLPLAATFRLPRPRRVLQS